MGSVTARPSSNGATAALGILFKPKPTAPQSRARPTRRADGRSMSPSQVLTAATKTSADVLRLTDRGRLEPGSRADLLVLDANPLDDITHTTRIAAVYQNGVAVDRAALRQGFSRP